MTIALRVFLLAIVVGLVAGQEYQARSASGSSSVENAFAPNSAPTLDGGVSSSSSVASRGSDAIPTTPPPFVTSKPARTFHAVVGRTTGSSTTPTNTGTSESSDSPVSTQDQPSASTDPSIATSDPATTSIPKRTITMKTFRPVVVGMTPNSDPASSTGTTLNQANPPVPETELPLAESATPATFRATIVANGTTNSATTSPLVSTSTPGANGVTPSNNGITVATPAAPAAAPSTSRDNAGGATVVGVNSPATASKPSATIPATTTRGQSPSTGSASTSPSATSTKATPQSSTSTNDTATGQQAAPTNTRATGNQSTTLESTRFGDAVDRANISTISVTKLDDGDGSDLNSSTIFQSSTSGSSGGLNVGNTGNGSGNDGSQVESQASGLGMNSGACASAVGVSATWAMMVLVVLW